MKESPDTGSQLLLDYLGQFTKPTSYLEEQQHLAKVREIQAKYTVGLVIGRFQPLHRGHIQLIHAALQISDRIIIGIGSANVENYDNPFSPEFREILLRQTLENEGLSHRIDNIVFLNDYLDDSYWLSETVKKTGNVNAVFGNNDWVNGIFRNAGIPAIEIPLFQRGIYEGRIIRQKLREEGLL